MKKAFIQILTWGLIVFSSISAITKKPESALRADYDGLALTPPMGWYPWNTFGEGQQNEKLIREMVEALIKNGLREAGYQYIGPDEGLCFYRAKDGRLAANLERYPSGLRGLGDFIHQRGLKYALYTDAGSRTCSQGMPGTRGHEIEDMQKFAEWRCDYLKIDWCNTEGQDIVQTYTLLAEAQQTAGRPIVHSLCSWGVGEPWKWAATLAHLWRTTGDICEPGRADWNTALEIVFTNEKLHEYAGPAHWNDPDMMIVGMPGLSEAQNRSLFSLWCIMSAPLIAGNDLRQMSESTRQILTNLEAIAVDQDPLGIQGRLIRKDGQVSIWGRKKLFDGSQAVLIFNQDHSPSQATISWDEFGFSRQKALYVRDLWKHQTTGPITRGLSLTVPPNDVIMLRLSRSKDFPLPPIISADTYLISLRSTGSKPEKLSASLTIHNAGTADLPLWKVHRQLPSWLSIKITKEGKNQVITNQVNTAGIKQGHYHYIVRLDNSEPVSGKPMTAFYYDLDLEVVNDVLNIRK
ncbi:MAG: glycoside hydrolase family 27 protein [Candidatus Saccharicenans sp.]|uniref:glycoside hydrolase family 27 protein n=1 Tax=Candidatus Saccharicenans sp. TaxID=2819258 RepID=UPI00404B0E20